MTPAAWRPRSRFRRAALRLSAPLVNTILVLVVVAAVGYGVWWLMFGRNFSYAIQRGVDLLSGAATVEQVEAALNRWEGETGDIWRDRRDAFIEALFDRRKQTDAPLYRMLARVSGCDYGDRADDWQRWRENRRRLVEGELPRQRSGERIRFEQRWQAPLGLSAWFTTMFAADGVIYAASLGTGFDAADDHADGIVRVDGASGHSELIFVPPDRNAGDVMGIADSGGGLFAVTRNGYVYSLGLDGAIRWKAGAGGVVTGPPLSIDLNRDGIFDALVMTRGGRVVAFSGQTGRISWTAAAPRRAARRDEGDGPPTVFVGLAAGPWQSTDPPDIFATTPDGVLRVLQASNGNVRFEGAAPAGFLGGGMATSASEGQTPVLAADRDAVVHGIVGAGRRAELHAYWRLFAGAPAALIAGLRSIRTGAGAPAVLATSSGAPAPGGGCVGLLDAEGLRWRYVTRGVLWATPAVADLSGDKQPEIILPTMETAADGTPLGVLEILSRDGHVLRVFALDAPVEAAPLVADLDGDLKLEVLLADRAGRLTCYATDGIGPVEWGSLLGDPHNTANMQNAYSYGQVPFGYQGKWKPDF